MTAAEVVGQTLQRAGFDVSEIVALPGGWGGASFRAETTTGPLVVKLRKDRRPLLAAKSVTAVLALHGIPHPEVVVTPTATTEGWIMAQRWIEGISVEATEVKRWADRDAAQLGADLGRWLSRLHAVELHRRVWLPPARRRYVGKLRRCQELSLLDGQLAAAVERRWSDTAGWLATVPLALIHRDLQPGNIVVHDGRFAAVIDFEQARTADPLYDFVKLREWVFPLHPAIEPALNDAYGMNTSMLEYLSALVYFAKHNNAAMVDDQRARLQDLVLSGRVDA
ncbi:aminoglycoside phosphotransferase family protein [Dactylosporangium sp. NPDC000555]|uniref:aminoglycoside phosphotransferase family protein n=1 Tax=Dactylosporangium sp. NPDC000555 TaxID=3154260 RepID=UPI003316CE7F